MKFHKLVLKFQCKRYDAFTQCIHIASVIRNKVIAYVIYCVRNWCENLVFYDGKTLILLYFCAPPKNQQNVGKSIIYE